jgi:hypothetical protein
MYNSDGPFDGWVGTVVLVLIVAGISALFDYRSPGHNFTVSALLLVCAVGEVVEAAVLSAHAERLKELEQRLR